MAEPPTYPGMPRWVKVFGTIFLIVVVVFFTVLFTRGPHHGPGRHASSCDAGCLMPPLSVMADTPGAPPGGHHG
jgi:hypothetical protein